MDSSHAVVGASAFFAGWWVRHLYVTKEEPAPCKCVCNCAFSLPGGDNSGNWGSSGVLIGVILVLTILLANLAVACKISWVNKGDEKEISLTVSHQKGQGKQRGVFSPARGLQITG